MKYFSIVYMFDGKTDLCEPIEYLIFVKEFFVFLFLCDGFRKISTLSILHYNFEFILFGDVDFDKLDDIGMIEISEDLCFFDGLISLLL